MYLHAVTVVGQKHTNWSLCWRFKTSEPRTNLLAVTLVERIKYRPARRVCVCVIFTAGLLNSQLALWSVPIPDTHYKQLTPVHTDIRLHEVGGWEGSQPHLRRMDLHCSTHVNLHPSSSSFSGVRREHIAALYIYHILWAAEQGKQKEIWGC